MKAYEVVIVGGGPAGLAAAIAARENGIRDILILERDGELGGILNQCIHNGFGLHTFQEELTGPEYADRFIRQVKEQNIEYKLNTMVMHIEENKKIIAMNRQDGMFELQAEAVILAMGCRERPRGALNIPGYRPAGIFSAGTAQRLVNIEGYMPGREVVILGSGDIGLIMARRITLEGAKVKVVAELMPYSGGLKRNIVQCLDDYGIPLKLSHTVVDIHGKERVEGVTLAEVDEKGNPIPGTEEEISCDTLLLSVGLIPENELSRECGMQMDSITRGPIVTDSLETSVPGIFACGNVLHVHDLVDFVSEEAGLAGTYAAEYVKRKKREKCEKDDKDSWNNICSTYGEGVRIIPTGGVRYTVPQVIHPASMGDKVVVRFRVARPYRKCRIRVDINGKIVMTKKRPVMAPGEMESIVLERKKLEEYPHLQEITIQIEEA